MTGERVPCRRNQLFLEFLVMSQTSQPMDEEVFSRFLQAGAYIFGTPIEISFGTRTCLFL